MNKWVQRKADTDISSLIKYCIIIKSNAMERMEQHVILSKQSKYTCFEELLVQGGVEWGGEALGGKE